MASQPPDKVSADAHARIRYLAALAGLTQGEIGDVAVSEVLVRQPAEMEKGLAEARTVLGSGSSAVAAYLLGMPVEDVERVAGVESTSTSM